VETRTWGGIYAWREREVSMESILAIFKCVASRRKGCERQIPLSECEGKVGAVLATFLMRMLKRSSHTIQ
jgi:hypothetical protein